jgi:hypothetical protein
VLSKKENIMSGLPTGLWESFISFLFQSQAIEVPGDFHNRAAAVATILDNDITGVVSTVINYAIESASEAQFSVECTDESLENILDLWLERINLNINGVPAGLQELAKEYYKERWAGSSLCLLRVGKWEKISLGKNSIIVPTVLWYVNGSSIYIKRGDETNYILGSDEYFLDSDLKIKLPSDKNEKIMVQKPTGRWFTKYPNPYLIQQGVYKNWKALEVLQSKSNEVISKVLPYLFLIEKGDKDSFIQKDVDYSDVELKSLVDNFKTAVEQYNSRKGEIPVNAVPYDQKYSHLIPDLKNILSEELYKQGYRAILSGLGFISIVQGLGDTRKEEVINPKPFVAEVNSGVDGFKSMLMDIIRLIIIENKIDHRKLFSDQNSLRVINTPLKINTSLLLDNIRTAYIYGTISVKTYQEILGIDPEQELERMQKEWSDGLREIYYPHLIQNQENIPDSNISPVPVTKKQEEKQNEKTKVPPTMNKAEENLEVAPYQNLEELLSKHPELKKYPVTAQRLFMEVWNSIYKETNDESRAFSGAWSQLKRWMKRHNKKETK